MGSVMCLDLETDRAITYIDWYDLSGVEAVHYGPNEKGILMEFIGRKDNKFKDIYEGDIVCAKREKGDIIGCVEWWDNSEFRVVQNDGTSGWVESDFEIIGNIHQDPELLDGHTSNDVLERLKGG